MEQENQIYWEKQGLDQLCGVHCLNSLLQGPFFDEVQLSKLALELDIIELTLMTEGASNDPDDLQQYLKVCQQQGSNNVADDGNFSIQVLQEALKKTYNLSVESIDQQIYQGYDLTQEQGFICNLNHHWYALRKINDVWYNLNSLLTLSPEIISSFFLSAFLQSVKDSGFSVFVVKGQFPHKKSLIDLNQNQKLLSCEEVKDLQEIQRIMIQDQKEQQYNIQSTLKSYTPKVDEAFDPDDQAWKSYDNKQSYQKKLSIIQPKSNYSNFTLTQEHDHQFRQVLLMSLQSKFLNFPYQGINISFLFPSGRQLFWMFQENDKVEDLYDFVLTNVEKYFGEFILRTNLQILFKVESSIKDAQIHDNDVIHVQQMGNKF